MRSKLGLFCQHPLPPVLLRFPLHRRSRRVLHLEPIGRAAGTVGGILALRDNAFEAFSNVVLSRSMNHNGVEFLILARPGRDQWTVVISYPRSTNPTKVPFEGSRDKAIAECIRSGGVWEAKSNIELLALVPTPAAADWDASVTMERINF